MDNRQGSEPSVKVRGIPYRVTALGFPARLLGTRDPSGGAVECLLLARLEDDLWDALVHPGQKLQPGTRMVFRGP